MTIQRRILAANVHGGTICAALFVAAWLIAYGSLPLVTVAFGVVAAMLIVLLYPWLPWVAFAALLPFLAAVRFAAGTPADLLLGGCLAVWLTAGIAKRALVLTPNLPLWALYAFIVSQAAALTVATDLGEGLVEVVKWAEFAAVLLVVPTALTGRRVGWLITGLLVAAAAQGLLGLYQFIYRIGPEWFLIQGRFMRAAGTFRQPNPYAGYLGLTLPLATTLALWTLTRWWQQRDWWRVALAAATWAALAATGVGLIASWSRGGWFGALGAIGVVMLVYSRFTRWFAFGGVIAGFAGLILGMVNPTWLPAGVRNRVVDLPAYFGGGDIINQPVTDENFAVIERLAHWVAALRMWESNVWLGVGPGNYNAAYPAVALPRWAEPLGHAHNIYLNTLAESGLLGFIAFIVMWTALVGWVIGQIKKASARYRADAANDAEVGLVRALGVGSLGMLTYLAIHSFFDNLFVQGIYLHFALWLACLAAAYAGLEHRNTASSERREKG